jgi:hypothetical protein
MATDTSEYLTFQALVRGGLPSYGNEIRAVSVYSAAPEPAAWALMMVGVGGMGAALRTRRRKAVAAA